MRKKETKMINNCKFFSMVLGICSHTNRYCQYIADPHSCPDYDDEFDRPYPTKSKITGNIETESLTEFADRIESELNGMGIKVERTEETKEKAPDWF